MAREVKGFRLQKTPNLTKLEIFGIRELRDLVYPKQTDLHPKPCSDLCSKLSLHSVKIFWNYLSIQ